MSTSSNAAVALYSTWSPVVSASRPLLLDCAIAAGVLGPVRDARNLEPDDKRRMVGNPLCIGLGEADANVVGAVETLGHLRNNSPAGFPRQGSSAMTAS